MPLLLTIHSAIRAGLRITLLFFFKTVIMPVLVILPAVIRLTMNAMTKQKHSKALTCPSNTTCAHSIGEIILVLSMLGAMHHDKKNEEFNHI